MANRDAKLIERTLKDFSLNVMSGSGGSSIDGIKMKNDFVKVYNNYKINTYLEHKEEIDTWLEGAYNYCDFSQGLPLTFEDFKDKLKKQLSKSIDLSQPLIKYFYTDGNSRSDANIPFEYKISFITANYNGVLTEYGLLYFRLDLLGDNNTFADIAIFNNDTTTRIGLLQFSDFGPGKSIKSILNNYTLEEIIDMIWNRESSSGGIYVSNYADYRFNNNLYMLFYTLIDGVPSYVIPIETICKHTIDSNYHILMIRKFLEQESKTLSEKEILEFVTFKYELIHSEPIG